MGNAKLEIWKIRLNEDIQSGKQCIQECICLCFESHFSQRNHILICVLYGFVLFYFVNSKKFSKCL